MIKYYIAINGNDAYDGLSENTAWKSMEKINSISLQPGDEVQLIYRGRSNKRNVKMTVNNKDVYGNMVPETKKKKTIVVEVIKI